MVDINLFDYNFKLLHPTQNARLPETVVSGAEVAGNAGDLSVFTGSAQQTAPTSEAKEPTTQKWARFVVHYQ